MMTLDEMKEFVDRAESGDVDASEFVDRSKDILEIIKALIQRLEFETAVERVTQG